jgi:hypothetical protein
MKRIIRLTESDLTRIVRRVANEQQEEKLQRVKLCDPEKFEEFMELVAQSTNYPMKLENAPEGKKDFMLLTFPDGKRCAVNKKEITFGI